MVTLTMLMLLVGSQGATAVRRSWLTFIVAASTVNHAPLFIQDHDGSNDLLIVRGNGRVGIGTTNPRTKLHTTGIVEISNADSNADTERIRFGRTSDALRYSSIFHKLSDSAANNHILFKLHDGSSQTEVLRIQGDNKIGFGGLSPVQKYDFRGDNHNDIMRMYDSANSDNIWILRNEVHSGTSSGRLQLLKGDADGVELNGHDGRDSFILSSLMIGKTASSFNTVGISLIKDGRIGLKTDGQEGLNLNRAQDGAVAEFRSADTAEGTISISGSTVSYNGFSGSHESSGIPTNTAIGTVVSTVDELDVYPDTDYKTGEAHNKAGETRADHAKIKISDSVGDRRVYGVLASFNEDNKPIVASVGIGSVKVTGACAGGDLLESNGDGTAKVQDDDIIRSKTIGKVTIGDSDTSVKLVSCVLYCG